MVDATTEPSSLQALNPQLLQVAQDWVQRPLTEIEAQTLLNFQRGLQASHAPGGPGTQAQQSRQLADQTIQASRNKAGNSVKTILQAIQAGSNHALQLQDQEEQAILKLVDGAHSLEQLRPSTLRSTPGGVSPASQMALTQIADRLATLAKQEVENCFHQYFGPLTKELSAVIERLGLMPTAESMPPTTASVTTAGAAPPASAPEQIPAKPASTAQ